MSSIENSAYGLPIGVAVAAAVVYGFLGISFQMAGVRRLDVFGFLFWKQLLGTALAVVACLIVGVPEPRAGLLGLSALGALSYIATSACYLMATRERDIAASWTVLNLSVMLPIGVSVIGFGDPMTLWKGLGIACTLISVLLIGGGFRPANWRQANRRWWKWIGLAFFCNGWLAVLLRFVGPSEGLGFTAGFYGLSFLLAAAVMLVRRVRPPSQPVVLLVAGGGAVAHLGGMVLTIFALQLMAQVTASPGLVVYPITNGLVIPVGVVLGMLLLRQKPDRDTTIGVLVGVAALTMFFV